MNVQQAELYQRIQAFSLDDPDADLAFSKRLARDNDWSAPYTQRVIEEYKKFTFLAVAAGHPVTPSDQVDQVWHLHLIYTHSYWGEFCPNVLQTPLHHGPTRGGRSEHHKFIDWYSKTLASYEHFFGEAPPTDIWHRSSIRFDQDLHFLRVNTQYNWILPKPSVELPKLGIERLAIAVLSLVLAITITGCGSLSLASISNPLNFNGQDFLWFFFFLAIAAIVWAYILGWYLPKALSRLPHFSLNTNSIQIQLVKWLSVLPFFAVLLLGIAKILVGISRDKPVGFLLQLWIITAIVGFCLYVVAESSNQSVASRPRVYRSYSGGNKSSSSSSGGIDGSCGSGSDGSCGSGSDGGCGGCGGCGGGGD